MYDDDVYTRLRLSANGEVEVLTVDAENQVTAVPVEADRIPLYWED